MVQHAKIRALSPGGAPALRYLLRELGIAQSGQYCSGAVCRPIVYSDHFIVVIVKRQHGSKRCFDGLLFIPRRDNDRNARIPAGTNRIAIPLRAGNIRYVRHSHSSINDP